MFTDGVIDNVRISTPKIYEDERGLLAELYRKDNIEEDYIPAMTYMSVTHPGMKRGPHEHATQTDTFIFLGSSGFRVYLWDNRKLSQTYQTKQLVLVAPYVLTTIVIPPGIVHAYQNIGLQEGWVLNAPNKLYKGWNRNLPVDEIRHEQNPQTEFILW